MQNNNNNQENNNNQGNDNKSCLTVGNTLSITAGIAVAATAVIFGWKHLKGE